MAKITEYPVVTEVANEDVLLVDGQDGTRGLTISGFAEALAGNVGLESGNEYLTLAMEDGGFSGNVGDTLSFSSSAQWKRASFVPTPGVKYTISYTTNNASSALAYVKTVDALGVVLADYAVEPVNTTQGNERTVELTFDETAKRVWIRGRTFAANELSAQQYTQGGAILNEKITEAIDNSIVYHAQIPDPESYTNSTFEDVYAAYDALCAKYPGYIAATDEPIGQDAANNPIKAYSVQKNHTIVRTVASSTNVYESYFQKKTFLLTSGVHGDEKSAVWGLYYFIKDLLESSAPWSVYITSNAVFTIIPVINPWGYNNNSRNNANDVNINRDYLTPSATRQPETDAVISVIDNNCLWNVPAFAAIDAHATTGSYGYIGADQSNPAISDIMKMVTDTIQICAPGWDQLASLCGYSPNLYPYAYGCLSVNEGVQGDYFLDNNLTPYALTVEIPKETGGAMSRISKFSSDMIGNLIHVLIERGDYDPDSSNGPA